MVNGQWMTKKAFTLLVGSFLLLAIVLGGCSGSNSEPEANSSSPETQSSAPTSNSASAPATSNPGPAETPAQEITLKVYTTTPQEFEDRFTDALKEKFPHITFENMPHDLGYVPGLQQLIISNDIPDLLMFNNGSMDNLLPLKLLEDLNPYFKKNNVQLNMIPGVANSVTSYSATGEFLVLPLSHQPEVLVYNKEIFDRFGLNYPQDGMSWDQVYDLAVKLTRTMDQVDYMGFDYLNYIWFNNQLSLPIVDPETNKSTFNTSEWKLWIENFYRFYQIPGNPFITNPSANGKFVTERNVAMVATQDLWALDELYTSEIDWDMVTMPTFNERPETGSQIAFFGAAMSNTNHYKDQTSQVIAYMLSDEYQQALSEGGLVPISNNPDVIKHFGVNEPHLQGKNTQALFKLKIAERPLVTPYNLTARRVVTPSINDIMSGKMDVVTGLIQAEEKINNAIATEQQK